MRLHSLFPALPLLLLATTPLPGAIRDDGRFGSTPYLAIGSTGARLESFGGAGQETDLIVSSRGDASTGSITTRDWRVGAAVIDLGFTDATNLFAPYAQDLFGAARSERTDFTATLSTLSMDGRPTPIFELRENVLLRFSVGSISAVEGRDPLRARVDFLPASLTRQTGTPPVVRFDSREANRPSTSNFRLEIPGVDCSEVISVDGIGAQRSPTQEATGSFRDSVRTMGPWEVEPIQLVVTGNSINSFLAWQESFVNRPDEKTSIDLVLLDASNREALHRIRWYQVGVKSVEYAPFGGDSQRRPELQVVLYAEQINLNAGGGRATATSKGSSPAPSPTPAGKPAKGQKFAEDSGASAQEEAVEGEATPTPKPKRRLGTGLGILKKKDGEETTP